ncbi:MAG TPA: hypothetical protein VLI41_09760 [Phenylobacterium sp.]|nr:hypothetical protein [Phenylobacterium sp.]HSV03479.1 hypothetical protein [Phenylobacterium sp.]
MKPASAAPSYVARLYFIASMSFACASAVLLALANLQPAGAF